MNRQKKIASVLAGVSFLALSVAATPSLAAGTRQGTPAPQSGYNGSTVNVSPSTSQYDFISISGVTTTGNVVIDEDLGGGAGEWNDVGFEALNNAIINGDLIVNSTADVAAQVTVTSTTNDASTSVAAIYIHDGAQVDGSIINNGNITGFAKADSWEDAEALAFGVATIGDLNPSLTNNKTISGSALATGYDTSVGIAGGVGQVVGVTTATGDIVPAPVLAPQTATIYNAGTISSTATVKSIDGQGDADNSDIAVALGLGAGQLILAVGSAEAYITNTSAGSISVDASASAFDAGTDIDVAALGAGVGMGQIAVALQGSAYAGIQNDGSVDVNVNAKAVSENDDASAIGVGIGSIQAAIGYTTATADLVNTDTIHSRVDAYAAGLGPNDSGTALAISVGNAQLAIAYGSTAQAHAFNSGTIAAAAYASANGYTANAIAAAIGNAQIAAGAVADTYLDNSGDISVNASATAIGSGEAFGLGAGIGALQAALSDEGNATATIINSGAIDVNVHVYASGSQAAAGIPGFGIGGLAAGALQVAIAYDEANVSLDNSNSIDVNSFAEAYGSNAPLGAAVANAEAAGVGQIAVGFLGDANADLTNTSLNSISADADAYASGYYALADGYGFGVAQVAVSYGSDASATIGNSGEISVSVDVTANGVWNAYDEGNAAGAEQLVIGRTATATINNTGVIEATANVNAYAEIEYASANASSVGTLQAAIAYDTAVASLFNENEISASAMANATGYSATAVAYATATGVGQVAASRNGVASALIQNSSSISAEANGFASSVNDSAYATAAAFGAAQQVSGIYANANIVNTSTISAEANATAYAQDQASAFAYATGADQTVEGYLAVAQLSNTSTISGKADAYAVSTASDAYATAEAKGVEQDVFGIDNATALVTNTSNISADAVATAFSFSSEGDDAYASAEATGVDQYVSSKAHIAQAAVYNNSSITARADAYAVATGSDAYASAEALGVDQDARGIGALATLSNNSTISGVAYATASAFGDDAGARASGTGASQDVEGEAYAQAMINNTGSITGKAEANAVSTGNDAYATAYATGASQYAGAQFAQALIYNSSTISADASAFATGYDTVGAYARADGVYQEAEGYGSGNPPYPVAQVGLENSSLISAAALASAIATDNGNAYATASAEGVRQIVEGAGGTVGIAEVVNTGTIEAMATANAYASLIDGRYAEASASAAGVVQYLGYNSSLGTADASVTNSNSISATANASAYATEGYSEADANAYGVYQYVAAGAASADVYNTNSISATANAFASATSDTGPSVTAEADAYAAGVGQDGYGYNVALTVTNHGDITATAKAEARAPLSYEGEASASASAIYQDGYGDLNTLIVDNHGTVMADASAMSTDASDADAYAYAAGVYQYANGENNSLTVDNEYTISAKALANSYSSAGTATAFASASGVVQEVDYNNNEEPDITGINNLALTNVGTISAGAVGYAEGSDEVRAGGEAYGVVQLSDGAVAVLSVTNSNSISASAKGNAYATDGSATANGTAEGVYQYGVASQAYLSVVNTSSISANAVANATAYTDADAYAFAGGVGQHGDGGITSLYLSNVADISAVADANALSTGSDADAYGSAVGAYQLTHGSLADATLDNEGDITADVTATADAQDDAYANAGAFGAVQESLIPDGPWDSGYSVVANLTVNNLGLISASANAQAMAVDGYASASATGIGVIQHVHSFLDSSVTLNNEGDISGSAVSKASGGEKGNFAAAVAFGHNVGVNDFDPLLFSSPEITVNNAKGAEISAFASASAADSAYAAAVGGGYYGYTLNEAPSEAGINNAGIISAAAFAQGAEGTASAIGVLEASTGVNDLTLTNTGVISAYAETNGGADAYATGVWIVTYGEDLIPLGAGPEAAPALFEVPIPLEPVYPLAGEATVNNDGGVIEARYSNDGGDTIHRGVSVNTRGANPWGEVRTRWGIQDFGDAPNPVVINLTGGDAEAAGKQFVIDNNRASKAVQSALAGYDGWGYIHGDMLLTEDDTVNVTDGVTLFDGQFNPDMENVGDLVIDNGGKLVLLQPYDSDAQSGGYVDNLTVTSTGSLAYELTTSDAAGDYAQIDANTANLDGNIVAIYNPGLYGNELYFDNVVSSDARTGQFAAVVDNSILLDTQQVVDGNNIDLKVDRVAFNKVAGLTKNQKATGGGIEKVYSQIDEDTNFGRMVANMFTLDKGSYQDLLNQLSGAEYANHLQSVLWSTRAIDRIITERMECTDGSYQRTADGSSSVKVGNNTVTPTADVVAATGCFHQGEGNVWMSGFGQWNSLSGDKNAPGYDETQYGILFGADYAFTDDFFAGLAGGYFNSQGDFDRFGGRSGASIDYDGLQIAAYGGYDNSLYYLRGIVAYGNYSGDSHRMFKYPGSAAVDPSGSPDSDTWSFYGETGYRFNVMTSGTITPFLGLSLASANLDGFTEKDPEGTGAALTIHDSDASSVASVLGARFTADMAVGGGTFSPIVSVAWMHEFDDTAQQVNMSFAGAPKGANFTVTGSEVARDTAVVDVGGKFMLSDSFDMGLFYNGQFNADYTSNAVTATLGYRF